MSLANDPGTKSGGKPAFLTWRLRKCQGLRSLKGLQSNFTVKVERLKVRKAGLPPLLVLPFRVQSPILLAEFCNLAHHKPGYLKVSSRLIFLRQVFREIEQRSEMYANLFAASPVAQHLFGKIVPESGNKNRDDLRCGVLN